MRQRRLKIRNKKYSLYKKIHCSNIGNNDKHVEIDKIIEADYKYFGAQTKSRDKEIYKIRTQAKNVEIILNKRN